LEGDLGNLPDSLRSVNVVAAIRKTIEIATQKCWLPNKANVIR